MKWFIVLLIIASIHLSVSNAFCLVVIGDNSSYILIEKEILDTLREKCLSDRIINVDSLNHEGKTIVGITFFYGLFYAKDKDSILQDLFSYSSCLTKLVFQSFPYITELDLSGIYRDEPKVDEKYREVTFSTSIRKEDFEKLYNSNISFAEFLDETGRVYYADPLLTGDLKTLKAESYVEENSNREKSASSRIDLLAKLRALWVRFEETRTGGIHKNTVWRGNPYLKEISITFDDGPRPVYTPMVLDILNKDSIKATFFIIGKRAMIYPYFVRDIVANGHTIGNHTVNHLNLTLLPYNKKEEEILNAQDIIYGITGERCRYFRPPGGDYDEEVEEILQKNSILLVLWTRKLGDYLIPPKDDGLLLKKAEQEVIPGGIIVFHIGVRSTVDILPEFLSYVKRQGYKVVPLEKLIKDSR